MSRTRSRSSTIVDGYFELVASGTPQPLEYSSTLSFEEYSLDTANQPGVDHPFQLQRWRGDGFKRLNGTYAGGGPWNGSSFTDYYPPGGSNSYSRTHLTVDNSINSGDFATLLARTNPSRPDVTPLELIQDLVDIPRQLKDVGRLLKGGAKNLNAKELANQNLGIQFGWLPLIQDVKDLLDLQSHIHRRVGELNRLYSSQGLKRRLTLNDATAEQVLPNQVWCAKLPGTLKVDMAKFTKSTKWGTVRWKPDSVPPHRPTTLEMNRQARKIVSGFTSEGLTQGVWNILPWTWLVDWFVPVGDFLLQHSNTVPAHPVHINVMRRTVSITKCTRVSTAFYNPPWLLGGEGSAEYVTLEREQSSSALPASLPFIGLKKLSILGSLFIQRFK